MSACHHIEELKDGYSWNLSQLDANVFNPAISAGYEVRDPLLSFDLPYMQPTLPSGDDLIEMCGVLKYTVVLTSDKPGPYEDAFAINLEDSSNYLSAMVNVQTIDQSYALHSGEANKDYRTEYSFSISFVFETYEEEFGTLTLNQPIKIFIRDYCRAMSFN